MTSPTAADAGVGSAIPSSIPGSAPESLPAAPSAAGLEIPPYLALLWSGDRSDRPGPKRGVDLPTIAEAGVRIADAEGVGAVSMRRLAAELGYTTMALYRYVRSKDELMLMLIDAAYGPVPADFELGRDWREGLSNWAAAVRGGLMAHPWILEVTMHEPPTQPHQTAWMELGLRILADSPLTHQERLSSLLMIDVYVRGQTHLTQNLLTPKGSTDVDPSLTYVTRLATLTDEDRFPNLRKALLSGAFEDEEVDFSSGEFSFGLDTLLDGVEARINRRRAKS